MEIIFVKYGNTIVNTCCMNHHCDTQNKMIQNV